MTNTDQNARVLDQFGKQAASYAALINRTKNTSLEPLLAALQPSPTDRLLDVGCGTGRFAISIAPFVAQVIGVDLTTAMLDQARQAQLTASAPNIEWQQADVAELPFADQSFDIVSSNAMLHHVDSPARVMAEMHRVCKVGGRVLVVDLTPHPDKAAAFDAIEILRDPSHAHAMTNAELRAIGAELGLTEVMTREYAARLPLEHVLQTSFPGEGMVERVRRLYRTDATTGSDAFGMHACLEDGQILVAYPMTMAVWQRTA